MNRKSELILEKFKEINPDGLTIDGFNDCIVGICNMFHGSVLIYDELKIVETLANNPDNEMTIDEAWDYYEYNIIGSYMGEYTPVFLMANPEIDE